MTYTHNPMLLCDFYKVCHQAQYPKGFTKIVSPYTPRMSRLPDTDHIAQFGCQAFCQEYLIKMFNTCFFNRPEEEIVKEYVRVLHHTIGDGAYDETRIRDLHRLGYLPIQVCAVPEGMRTKIGVPQIEISNTHPNFAWLTNAIETLISSYMWHIQIAAEVGYRYRKIVDKWVNHTCDDNVDPRKMLGDFSMRGQQSPESAIKASGAWCLSFDNTATVPAIMWLEDNYNCNCEHDKVAYGAISTEHSVMCSNFAVDGDEITHIKRLLTEIYPNNSFSMVSDSYDYWRLVTELLPQCKTEIENHNGYLAIRGDSGDPVEVIAGKKIEYIKSSDYSESEKLFTDDRDTASWLYDYCRDNEIEEDCKLYFNFMNKLYEVSVYPDWTNERGAWTDNKYYYVDDYDFKWKEIEPDAELMGTVWALEKIFGSTVNEKGYKVLPPYIKAIYGDSITPQRCEEIYKRLTNQGFAINNVSLGVGSFSFMCLETTDEDGNTHYNPYTRDTFGVAIKATYAEDKDGNPIMVYKQPKALAWKKSQKGCCIVSPDGEGYTDEHTFAEAEEARSKYNNLLQVIFRNGEMIKTYTLNDARENMYPGGKIR